MFREGNNLLQNTTHGEKNGCVGVTYTFIPQKSTKFGNFLDFKTYIYILNRVLHLNNTNIKMK